MTMLGPATVGFAPPIYQQRVLIRANWPLLLPGMVAGTATCVHLAYALVSGLGLDPQFV